MVLQGAMTRRYFLRLLAGLPLWAQAPLFLSAPAAHASLGAEIPPRLPIGQTFSGEVLQYEIEFPVFGTVASLAMTFGPAENKGEYVCTLQGETLGFFGISTRYRKDSYRSVMEELDGGARLRSLLFEEQVRIGHKSKRRTHVFDHGKRKWVVRSVRKSGATSEKTYDIPHDRDYNDFLTAACNFRYGVYGPPERGRMVHVPVFPKKGIAAYDVKIASAAEEERLRRRGAVRAGSEYRIELTMDPEILNSRRGLINGWLAKELYPVEGVMEDVFFFGDVRGALVKRRIRGEVEHP